MPRYIDADALIQDLKDRKIPFNADINEAIICAPTVDAEPVRHGRWIKKRNPMMYQLLPYVWVCNQCGTAFYYKTPYCMECGAKMDEEEK